MATEKRLIDANALIEFIRRNCCDGCNSYEGIKCRACEHDDEILMLEDAPTVDAVEVVRIEETKKEILQTIDVFIAEYRHISQSSIDHFGGKAEAMETARRLVNAALTDLCPNCGAKMDGERRKA